jgi:hypothetical protein
MSELAPPAVAARLRSATLSAWSRIIDLAIERGVAQIQSGGFSLAYHLAARSS